MAAEFRYILAYDWPDVDLTDVLSARRLSFLQGLVHHYLTPSHYNREYSFIETCRSNEHPKLFQRRTRRLQKGKLKNARYFLSINKNETFPATFFRRRGPDALLSLGGSDHAHRQVLLPARHSSTAVHLARRCFYLAPLSLRCLPCLFLVPSVPWESIPFVFCFV